MAIAGIHPFINNNNDNNIGYSYSAHIIGRYLRRSEYYPALLGCRFRRSQHREFLNFYCYPFNTWVESGKCRLVSCQRTLASRRDSNRGPCEPQSDDLSTRPQHLYTF